LDAVKTILSNATRLRKLIVDLLDAHKLEIGKMKFNFKKFEVNGLMESIQKSFSFTSKEKNIEIKFSVDGTITIDSDRDRIEQIISNLIYNAIDFVPKDTGIVEVSAQKIDDHVKFTVKDNGIGISKENQKGLFGKFYQADTTQTRKHGGTGLGLSICKGIVENLGGQIYVQSEENKGSNFYFVVPIQGKKS